MWLRGMFARQIVMVVCTGGLGAGAVQAEESDAYCGEGGPMIVSVEPITKDLDIQPLSHAKEDEGAAEIVAARDFNATAMSGSEMVAVITALWHAGSVFLGRDGGGISRRVALRGCDHHAIGIEKRAGDRA